VSPPPRAARLAGERREQRDPQRAVGAAGEAVDAIGLGTAAAEDRARLVGGRLAADAMDAREPLDHLAHAHGIGIREAAFDVDLGAHRQHRGFVERLERHGAGETRARRDAARGELGRLRVAEAHDALRGPRGLEPDAEQLEEDQALALGNQVRAVQQRVAQPREELDQRAAGIAEARIGPLRRVRGDARDEVVDQIVEAPVVETRGQYGHGYGPSSCSVTFIAPGAPLRASR
jgi:hypothetical protein